MQTDVIDDVGATVQVISANLLEFGIDNLIGSYKAFINSPRVYLLSPNGMPIHKENLIMQVLEDAGFDAILLSSLRY